MSDAKQMKPPSQVKTSWLRAHWTQLSLAALLLAGFALRMVDLTDAPLDFHPARQLQGAVIARSIYYQWAPTQDAYIQEMALRLRGAVGEYEPPILQSLAAIGYLLLGGEQLWVARILTSLAWVLGGWALYALAARISSPAAGLLALAYYLFLPFAVYASRSFQPDPLMTALVTFAAFAAYRWAEARSWKWALAAALVASLAMLVKLVAAYLLLGMFAALILSEIGFRRALKDRQVWMIALLCLLPSAAYYLFARSGSASGYFENWILALLPLAMQPEFYARWANLLAETMGFAALLAALTGVLIAPPRARWLLAGLWLGYLAYGITLPHQTTTHDYYHQQLVPILALSMAPVFALVIEKMGQQGRAWRVLFAGLLVAAIAFNAFVARSNLLAEDHRQEPLFWERIGQALPTDGKTIGLVQGYGNLLTFYGWRNIQHWPPAGEFSLNELRGRSVEDFEEDFLRRTAGMDYFLVTSFNQLEQQPLLNDYLYANFPIYEQGDGYVIFDLHSRQPGAN